LSEKPPHHDSMVISENYDDHWGFASFEGKTILDIGADWGSTTYYFLQHGAKKIVAVEGDRKKALELFANYNHVANVVCIEMLIKSAEQFEQLIFKYKPDIVKCDIEGDERYLLNVPVATIASIGEWLLETHSDDLHQKFLGLFNSLYPKVTIHYEIIRKEFPPVRVIWARR